MPARVFRSPLRLARQAAAVGAALVLLALIACGGHQSRAEEAGSPAAGDAGKGRWVTESIEVGDTERWYRLYVPEGLLHHSPVVVLLHGGTQSMRKIFRPRAGGAREWPLLADAERFLLVVPNGTNFANGDTAGDTQNWSDDRAGRAPRIGAADDIAFFRRLIARVLAVHRADAARIYFTGASNGGLMTYKAVREMSPQIAAGVAFIANLPRTEEPLRRPERPVPLMIVNGDRDPLMKWEGGPIARGRGEALSAQETLDWWLSANHATRTGMSSDLLADADRADGCRVTRSIFPGDPGGAEVIFVRLEGGGHTMPSRRHSLPDSRLLRRMLGPTCRDIEGAQLAWNFLKGHRLQVR